MNKTFEVFVTVLTAVSVIVMLIDYSYNLTKEQRLTIWIFDSGVVGILVLDFYMRMKSSAEGSAIFILRHWYEIPAMLPVFLFDIIDTTTLLGAGVRSLRLLWKEKSGGEGKILCGSLWDLLTNSTRSTVQCYYVSPIINPKHHRIRRSSNLGLSIYLSILFSFCPTYSSKWIGCNIQSGPKCMSIIC